MVLLLADSIEIVAEADIGFDMVRKMELAVDTHTDNYKNSGG